MEDEYAWRGYAYGGNVWRTRNGSPERESHFIDISVLSYRIGAIMLAARTSRLDFLIDALKLLEVFREEFGEFAGGFLIRIFI